MSFAVRCSMVLTGCLMALCGLPAQAAPNNGLVIQVRQKPSSAVVLGNDVRIGGQSDASGSFNALPEQSDSPDVSVETARSVSDASECIQQKLRSQFNLPQEFYAVNTYANNVQTVALVNPFTQTKGLQFNITPTGVSGSRIDLYDNGTTLSSAWKRIPKLCR